MTTAPSAPDVAGITAPTFKITPYIVVGLFLIIILIISAINASKKKENQKPDDGLVFGGGFVMGLFMLGSLIFMTRDNDFMKNNKILMIIYGLACLNSVWTSLLLGYSKDNKALYIMNAVTPGLIILGLGGLVVYMKKKMA